MTSNPRRYVGHLSGWRFVVEGGCFGPIVLAAAMRVMELLEVA